MRKLEVTKYEAPSNPDARAKLYYTVTITSRSDTHYTKSERGELWFLDAGESIPEGSISEEELLDIGEARNAAPGYLY